MVPKGLGIAKVFIKWLKTPKQRENFIKGHKSIANLDYLNEGYIQYIFLYRLIMSISRHHKLKKITYRRHLRRLNKLLEGKLK